MKLQPENVKYIIIHSSHTPNPKDNDGVRLLNRIHRLKGAFSWELGGNPCVHHYVVRRDGVVEEGRPIDSPGNHTAGFNEDSVSVCYIGGVNKHGGWVDTRTPEQKRAINRIVGVLRERFPDAVVVTHEQLAPRRAQGCPGFGVQDL